MKELKTLFILIGLFATVHLAAQPTLTFKLDNPQIFPYGGSDWFSFDIKLKAETAGSFLWSGQTNLSFNNTLFNTDPNDIYVEKGSILTGTYTENRTDKEKYDIINPTITGTTSKVLNLAWKANASVESATFDNFKEITENFQIILHVEIEITGSIDLEAEVAFIESSMNNQQFYKLTSEPWFQAYASPNQYSDNDFIDCYVGRIFSTANDWTQADVGLDWSTPANTSVWDGDATIPTSGESKVSDLRVHNGASLTIPETGQLTVSGTTDIETSTGGLIVESNSSSTGSVIFEGTVSGEVSYQRQLSGVNGGTDNWHLITSTSTNQTISNFLANNPVEIYNGWYGFASYNNSNISWDYETVAAPNTSAFLSGKGYEVLANSASSTLVSRGTPYSENYTAAISNPANGNSWNLIGNAYLAAINAHDFLLYNQSKINSNYTLYLWDADAATPAYEPVTQANGASYYIAPGQAFFINSAVESGTVSFVETWRTHQNNADFKNATVPNPHIRLFVDNGKTEKHTDIYYIDETSTGLDPGFDAGMFGLSNNSFAVYSKLVDGSEVDFAIQCLPNQNAEKNIIPIGLNAKAGQEIIFSAENENIPIGQNIFLEDKLLGTINQLTTSTDRYRVVLSEDSEGTGRFFLYTKSALTGIKTFENGFSITPLYAQKKLKINGNKLDGSRFKLLTVDGKVLVEDNFTNHNINWVSMNGIKSGIYLTLTEKEGKIYREKITWVNHK